MNERIFISYRRSDSETITRVLVEKLRAEFGEDSIFLDTEDIELGENFKDKIDAVIRSCDVVLAIIGPRWMSTPSSPGANGLDSESDFVRLEVEAAFRNNVRVVPVIVERAQMPEANLLPQTLVDLPFRQCAEIRPSDLMSDISKLVEGLRRHVGEDTSSVLLPQADVLPPRINPSREPDSAKAVRAKLARSLLSVGALALGAAALFGVAKSDAGTVASLVIAALAFSLFVIFRIAFLVIYRKDGRATKS